MRGVETRSWAWFDDPDNPGMTAAYLERYLHYGLNLEELQSGKPGIGAAQAGSDLSPCNRPISSLPSEFVMASPLRAACARSFPSIRFRKAARGRLPALDRNLATLPAQSLDPCAYRGRCLAWR